MKILKAKKDFRIEDIEIKKGDVFEYVTVSPKNRNGIYHLDHTEHLKRYNHTFSVNPYTCKLCGERGTANEKVLCDNIVGFGKNVVCEDCALKYNIEINDVRGVV